MRTRFAASAVMTAVGALLVACGGGNGSPAAGAADGPMSAMSADDASGAMRPMAAAAVAADPLAACSVTRSTSGAAVIPESRPKLLLANAELKSCLQEKYTRGAPEAMRFKALVDQKLGGGNPYNFSPWFAALVFQMSGELRYRDLAVRLMDDIVKSEEALIASGVHRNSYLEVDWYLGNLARVYDWAYDGLSAEQKARWIAYGNQAMWNVRCRGWTSSCRCTTWCA